MPTISQLAPATAASDTDEMLVSQAGTTRKITRSQVLAGVQPAITTPSGSLLGRSSANTGAPEAIKVGDNLVLANGTLSATAAPFSVGSLPGGTVPASGDLVAINQSGTSTAVTYGQFLSGLPSVPNLDLSKAVVIPTGSSTATMFRDFAARAVSTSGATMTGSLALSSDPSAPLQAATKSYVDTQVATALPKAGGTVTGALSLPAAPTSTVHAANKAYVDAAVATAVPLAGGTVQGALNLSADPVSGLQASTKQYVDTRVLRAGDTMTGALLLSADPNVATQAATKRYVDNQVATALPRTGGTLTGSLALNADPSVPLQAATKQYVDARVSRAGDTLTGALTLSGDPAVALQAATKQYVDGRVARTGDTLTGALILAADPTVALGAATKGYVDTQAAAALPKAGGTLSGTLTLSGDPVGPDHAATKRYADAIAASALPIVGGTLTGPLTLSADPTVTAQAANKQYVDRQVATSLPLAGGTVTGALSLASAPTAPAHAATKQYVDANPGRDGVINVKLPPYNAQLNGTTDDTAAFKAAYQAAPAGGTIYVPNGVTVLQPASTWGIPITKRVKWIVDGTTLSTGVTLADAIPNGAGPASVTLPGVVVGHTGTGAVVSQAGSQGTDFSQFHTSYIVNHAGGQSTVTCNTRSDTIIYNSPANFVWAGLDRLIWAGTQSPSGFGVTQHVGRYVQTIRQVIATDSTGKALPQPELWSACLEYRDASGKPSSWAGAGITVEMDWIGNGADDAASRAVQSLVIGQHDPAGAAVEVGSVIGVWLAAGSTGQVQKVLNVNLPFAYSVVDTTKAKQLTGAAAVRMAAGHAIAFEPTNTCRLALDPTTNVLKWYHGTVAFPVGRGISVGWQVVVSANYTLGAYLAGNIVFCIGSGAYTVTLPAANTLAPGTGFTFSVIGTAAVTIAPSGTDLIDGGPIVLRTNDRYHLVSDGSNVWREVFRTNGVNPRFSGPPVLPSYLVTNLPTGQTAGAKAFATNGRKPNEAAGAGTGVEVFFDGTKWVCGCTGLQVAA